MDPDRLNKAQGFYFQEAEEQDQETKRELLSFIRGEYFLDEPSPEEERWLESQEELVELEG